mmetsp:Transcript_5804/g.9653  ORF Transcript_5804/g.9653 Transcript_5804/m.9653 type:complete len:257 (+) Transcript_5804:43-813(+)
MHSQPPQPLETYADTSPPPSDCNCTNGLPTLTMNSELQQLCASLPASTKSDLLCYGDVYMDNFCLLAQGDASIRNSTRRHLFHVIDCVFHPNNSADSVRQEPNSIKKLRRGNTFWMTRKKMLGWLLDMVDMSISLPGSRAEKLQAALDKFPRHQKHTSAKKWYRLLGILCSIVDVIPGGRGLFCHLQNALIAHRFCHWKEKTTAMVKTPGQKCRNNGEMKPHYKNVSNTEKDDNLAIKKVEISCHWMEERILLRMP